MTHKTLFIDLERNSDALPNAVNPTGTIVVGKFASAGGFYWMPTTGVIDVGSFTTGVSADGDTIVGGSPSPSGVQNAAIWLRAMEWRLLGSFPNAVPCGADLSQANAVSRDGTVLVGSARNGCTYSHAFRWQDSTGMVDLGSLFEGRPTRADGVSGDGRVVVGYQENPESFRRGVRWVNGRTELFEGPAGPVGIAAAANIDGSIVTGATCVPVKYSPWKSVGLRGQVRYAPVILGDSGASDFCTPFGFCQGWLNRFEVAGGLAFRF